eukprot:TRINITY_DN12615_c0_g1_i1.p1 TRINITY_DN12615_c0_g1~~TRINITY_DN12615_c0_g1_i1.p1  ORF type:complete len:510 (+),score=78.03 TRINITY_DN12615_c0_g1_i1:116-1531(+)
MSASPGSGAPRKRRRSVPEGAEEAAAPAAAVAAGAAVAAAAATALRLDASKVFVPGMTVLHASLRSSAHGREGHYACGKGFIGHSGTALFSLRHGRGHLARSYHIGVTPVQEALRVCEWKVPPGPASIHRARLDRHVLVLEGTNIPPGADWCLLKAPSLRPLAREAALVGAVRGWLAQPFLVFLTGARGSGLRCVALGRPMRESSPPDAVCIPYDVAAQKEGGAVLCRAGFDADSPTFHVPADVLPRALTLPPQGPSFVPSSAAGHFATCGWGTMLGGVPDAESDSSDDGFFAHTRFTRARAPATHRAGPRPRQPGECGSVTDAAARQEQVGDTVCIDPGRVDMTFSRPGTGPPPAPQGVGLVVAKQPGGAVNVASGRHVFRLHWRPPGLLERRGALSPPGSPLSPAAPPLPTSPLGDSAADERSALAAFRFGDPPAADASEEQRRRARRKRPRGGGSAALSDGSDSSTGR